MYVYIERGLFNIHISNTIHWYSHAIFVYVFYLCGMAIQLSCFIVIHNSTPIFQNPIFNFFNSTLRIDNSTYTFQILFICDIRLCVLLQPTWCACVLCRVRYACSAIINILVLTLNFPFPVSPLQSRMSAHFAAYGCCTTTRLICPTTRLTCTMTRLTCTTTWLTSSHYINQP